MYVTVKLHGRPEHRRFQVLAARAYALRTGRTLALEPPENLDWEVYVEPQFRHQEIPPLKDAPNVALHGLFQSAEYWEDQVPHAAFGAATLEDAVGLHVQRGERLAQTHLYVVQPLAYYQRALAYMRRALPAVKRFEVVCADAEFAQRLLGCRQRGEQWALVDGDLSRHRGLIMSNTAAAWWFAYENNARHEKTVIAPDRWFNPDYVADASTLYCDWMVRIE